VTGGGITVCILAAVSALGWMTWRGIQIRREDSHFERGWADPYADDEGI
jgi:hypothetical protein